MKQFIQKYRKTPVQVRASIWFLICLFVQKVISVITTPIFTRIMNTSEYGEFNVFMSWLNILMVVFSLNLFYEVFEQGIIKFSDMRDEFASSMQGLELTLIFGWGIIYGLFHDWFNDFFSLNTVQMIMLFVIIWTTAAYNFWAVEQRARYEYKKLVVLTLFASFLIPIVGLISVIICKDKVTARIASIAIVQLLLYFWLFIIQEKNGRVFCNKKIWKYALSMNIPLLPHYLSQTVLNSADRIMIGKMIDENSAGIYSLAYSISLVMAMFNMALNQTIGPWYFKKIKENKIENIGTVIYPAFVIIAVVNIILIAFAPEVVRIFAPKSYYEAIDIIPPITMSVFFTFSYDMFCKFEFYYEKTKTIALITLVGAVVNIVLNYFFINKFGYRAAAYTTLLCYLIYAILHFISMNSICDKIHNKKKPFKTSKLLLISIGFVVSGFILQISYKNNILRYCLIASCFLIMLSLKSKIVGMLKLVYNTRSEK